MMSEKAQDKDPNNPYNSRDHESQEALDREDVLAVAGLLGNVSRNLADIDNKNVGGSNQFTQAKKIDPKAVLRDMTKGQSVAPGPTLPAMPVEAPESIDLSQLRSSPPPPSVDISAFNDIIKRLDALESALDKSNKAFKFKRGISYDINTAGIKGNFKSPTDIIDIILAELAKNTKTITLKLNDSNKNRK